MIMLQERYGGRNRKKLLDCWVVTVITFITVYKYIYRGLYIYVLGGMCV